MWEPIRPAPSPIPSTVPIRITVLDSGGMHRGDKTPDTLASLRRKARTSPGRPTTTVRPSRPDQPDLFAAFEAPRADPPTQAPEPLPVPAQAPKRPAPKPTSIDLPERRIWSVRALVTDIRQQIERTYTDLWVEGEISNCRPAPSGHIYFTLKDGEAQLPIVLFRRQAQLLRFRPADGLAVLVKGRISIYDSRGQLQLIAETLEPRGAGALQLAFEQLKQRLAAEGLFDPARKRPPPAFPHCVGIVTSPTGAVIRDIVTVIRRRHARLDLLVYPASMQGANCPGSVAAGIRYFNQHANSSGPGKVDLIILARGGGSLEDLAGFNDESLARTIAASDLPIVSAIGHETDFTIADFVADLRAPTPSAAAELVTAAQHRIEDRVAALAQRVHRAGRYQILHARQRYMRLSAEHVLNRLRDAVNRRDQRIDDLHYRLESAARRRLNPPVRRLAHLEAQLARHNPTLRLAAARRRLDLSAQTLTRLAARIPQTPATRINQLTARLEALSPLAVLNRGYALIYTEGSAQGQAGETLLHNSADTQPGRQIRARLAQGTLTAQVLTTESPAPNQSESSS